MGEEIVDFPTKEELKGTRNKKRRSQKKERNKLIRLVHESGYPSGGAYPVDKNGRFTEGKPAYIKRFYRHRTSKSIKRACHRKLRHSKKLVRETRRSTLRRCTEYWWELA